MPPAPGLFTTTNVWFSSSLRPFATRRAVESVDPPAAYGTIISTVRSGYAATLAVAGTPKNNAHAHAPIKRNFVFWNYRFIPISLRSEQRRLGTEWVHPFSPWLPTF